MSLRKINQETRVKILLSAKKEFAGHGFAGARMDTIAKNATVNKAMLHYYFNSKESLYEEVVKYLVSEASKLDFPSHELTGDLSSGQKLYIVMHFIVVIHFEAVDHDFHRILSWDFAEGRNCMKMFVKDFFAPALEKIEHLIVEGIKNGEFSSVNPVMNVWSLIIFIINYINQKEIYEGTPIYNKLYGSDPKQTLLDFLLVHIFKSLSTESDIKIPKVPPGLIKKLEDQIKEKKN